MEFNKTELAKLRKVLKKLKGKEEDWKHFLKTTKKYINENILDGGEEFMNHFSVKIIVETDIGKMIELGLLKEIGSIDLEEDRPK